MIFFEKGARQRNQHDHGKSQLPTDREHHDECEGDPQNSIQHLQQGLLQRIGDGVDIVRHFAQYVPELVTVK